MFFLVLHCYDDWTILKQGYNTLPQAEIEKAKLEEQEALYNVSIYYASMEHQTVSKVMFP